MNLKEVVHFIYAHALSMIEPWNDAVLETVTVLQLGNYGFRIVSFSDPDYYVEMKEIKGTIFVSVHGLQVDYSSMAHDQKKARIIYDEIVDALLAI